MNLNDLTTTTLTAAQNGDFGAIAMLAGVVVAGALILMIATKLALSATAPTSGLYASSSSGDGLKRLVVSVGFAVAIGFAVYSLNDAAMSEFLSAVKSVIAAR
jgi:hypothetical protein